MNFSVLFLDEEIRLVNFVMLL